MDVCVFVVSHVDGETALVVNSNPKLVAEARETESGIVMEGITSISVRCPPVGAKVYLDNVGG